LQIPRSTVPGIITPAIPGRMGSLLLSLLYQFEQTQWLDPDQLFAEQARQLRALFTHAGATVPFYKQRFAEAGIDPAAEVTRESFARLPILKRAELQAAGEAINTTALPKSHGRLTKIETSGSTGRPVRLNGSEVTGVFWRACVMREHLWQGRELSGKLAAIRWVSKGVAMPPKGAHGDNWGPASGSIYPTGPAALLNIASELAEQIDWLQREDPDYLISFPSNLAALATHCIGKGIRLNNLKQVMTVGETVSDHARRLVEQAWGVQLKDSYSCEEAGYLTIQCPEHDVYHVQSENVLLEVVDDDGRPCGPGEVGRVLITSLHNFATPLIRYELGDYAEVGAPCACGRGLPVITRVLGRKRNRLIMPDGRSEFPYLGDHEEFRAITTKVREFQYIQRSVEVIEKLMVVSEPLTPEEEAAQKALIAKNFRHPFEIRLTYLDEIPKRGAGKFEEFISEVEA
jgi:phenylacetate-coenzyme A ligase PaaK-like adenylate-forming protein